jgi:hypothetical protein
MTDSASTFMAILFAVGVFAVIVAVGWRSVQNRRILRLRGADGQETVIVAREDDEIESVVTTSGMVQPAPAPSVVVVNTGMSDPAPATEFGEGAAETEAALGPDPDLVARDRLNRVVSSTR